MTSSLSSFAYYENVNILMKDIPKKKMLFFFALKNLSNRQQLFFYFISTLTLKHGNFKIGKIPLCRIFF